MAYKRKTQEERMKEIEDLTNDMTEKIESYFVSEEALKEHLAFMSNFYNYSLRNMSLIDKQFMGATAVGSFKFWKDKGVSVKKGEKGIRILVPTPVEYFQRNGKMVQVRYATPEEKKKIKNKDIKTEKKLFFKVGHVFEYTQTNAREKGLEVSQLFKQYHQDGEIENNKEMLEALHKVADKVGFKILDEPRQELGTAKGAAYPYLKEIALNPRNTDYENVTTLIHELAHAKLHTPDVRDELTTAEREFQAEMVSYVVAKKYGIDTEEFTLSYLGGWTKGKELKDKEKLLNEVRDTAKEFIDTIDNHFEQVREKEKIIGLENYPNNELLSVIQGHIKESTREGVDDDFKITQIGVIGDRVNGERDIDKQTPLEVIVEYKGNYREDDIHNGLNEEPLRIDGIEVDFVPYSLEKGNMVNQKDFSKNMVSLYKDKAYEAFPKFHEQNSLTPIKEPVMLIHQEMDSFKNFGEVNNMKFDELKSEKIDYTVAIPNGENFDFVRSIYNKNDYAHPLHHMEKNNVVDNDKYSLLEKNYHDVLLNEDKAVFQSLTPRIKQALDKEEKSMNKKAKTLEFELER